MRIRETYNNNYDQILNGIVEVDETYFGGKKAAKGKGRDIAEKQAVIGIKERNGKIISKPITTTDKKSLPRFIFMLVHFWLYVS